MVVLGYCGSLAFEFVVVLVVDLLLVGLLCGVLLLRVGCVGVGLLCGAVLHSLANSVGRFRCLC